MFVTHADRAGRVSRRTIVTGSNATAVIDNLIEHGLLKRAVTPEDRRAAVILITPEVQVALDQWAPEHAARIAAIFRDFPVRKKDEEGKGLVTKHPIDR